MLSSDCIASINRTAAACPMCILMTVALSANTYFEVMNTVGCLINCRREETARSWFASSFRARATNASASTKILRGAFMICLLVRHKDSGQYSQRDTDRHRRPIASSQSPGEQLSRTDQCSFVLPVLLSECP